jgi:glutamate-1-semialdehyde 2,1-aminomutase
VCRDKDKNVSLSLRTLFLQETIAQGVLMPYLAISYSHDDLAVQQTLEAAANALEIYRRALQDGVENYLVGPAVKPVFRKFN